MISKKMIGIRSQFLAAVSVRVEVGMRIDKTDPRINIIDWIKLCKSKFRNLRLILHWHITSQNKEANRNNFRRGQVLSKNGSKVRTESKRQKTKRIDKTGSGKSLKESENCD